MKRPASDGAAADRIRVRLLDPGAVDATWLVRGSEWLTGEERRRAAGIARPDLRHQHLCTRVLQRLTLSEACGVPPEAWRFAYHPAGRPYIAAPEQRTRLSFSVSHTKGLIACAVAAGSIVGVDVEHVEAALDVEAVARRFFAPQEAEAVLNAVPDERRRAFLRHWTVKEACLKVLGTGLATPLDAVRLDRVDEDGLAHLSFDAAMAADPRDWRALSTWPTDVHALGVTIRGTGPAETVFDIAWAAPA